PPPPPPSSPPSLTASTSSDSASTFSLPPIIEPEVRRNPARARNAPNRLGGVGATDEQVDAFLDIINAQQPVDDAPVESPEPEPPPERSAHFLRRKEWHTVAILKVKKKGLLVPAHRGEAKASDLWPKWARAEILELTTLKEKGVYELARPGLGQKIFSCHWVYDLKRDDDGALKIDEMGLTDGQKARIVFDGNHQTENDWTARYAATVSAEALRLVIGYAARPNYALRSADVKGAYLNSPAEREMLMRIPVSTDPTLERLRSEGRVWRLLKCLYGMVQSGHEWSKMLRGLLEAIGYICLDTDRAIYVLRKGASECIIPTHVDDLLGAMNDESLWTFTITELGRHINFSKEGPLSLYLGIRIEQAMNGVIVMAQTVYVEELLLENGMQDAKPASTPMRPNTFLLAGGPPLESIPLDAFRALVAKLGWLSITTRFDILLVARCLQSIVHDPREPHYDIAKYCLRYLAGTKDYGLKFEYTGDKMKAFSDSNWGHPEHSRSRSGWFVELNGPISAGSLLQGSIAHSSAEAEYYVTSTTMKKTLPIMYTAAELNIIRKDDPTDIEIDNTSCISMLTSENITKNSRHIQIRYHFVRDMVAKKIFKPNFIPTDLQKADMFTKSLERAKFEYFREQIYVVDVKEAIRLGEGSKGGHG
ncbi:hypothetical protein P7C70_g5250, partial [Phenoliferia sp. Uapishka_3]